MPNATPEQVAKTSEALKKLQDKRRKEQELFRSNPDKLAAEIAKMIRMDNHAGEDPNEYENGAMHWFQGAWGFVKAKAGSFQKLAKPVRSYYWDEDHQKEWGPNDHAFFEVTCPTTGCIAGWADSLAGYNLVFRKAIDWEEREHYAETNPQITEEEIVLEHYSPGEAINIEDCYDPTLKQVRPIQDVAKELLNLGSGQSEWLFNGNRTKDEVLWALDLMAAGDFDWDGDYCDVLEDDGSYEDVDA